MNKLLPPLATPPLPTLAPLFLTSSEIIESSMSLCVVFGLMDEDEDVDKASEDGDGEPATSRRLLVALTGVVCV